MKDLQKTLSQEQKEAIYEFVAGWIKSGRTLSECMFGSMRVIDDGDIHYTIAMSTFHNDKLYSIILINHKLNVRISVEADDIQNRSLVNYITTYMNMLTSSESGELSNKEFNEITNLEIDLSMSRSKKVRQLQEKMKDETENS